MSLIQAENKDKRSYFDAEPTPEQFETKNS